MFCSRAEAAVVFAAKTLQSRVRFECVRVIVVQQDSPSMYVSLLYIPITFPALFRMRRAFALQAGM